MISVPSAVRSVPVSAKPSGSSEHECYPKVRGKVEPGAGEFVPEGDVKNVESRSEHRRLPLVDLVHQGGPPAWATAGDRAYYYRLVIGLWFDRCLEIISPR